MFFSYMDIIIGQTIKKETFNKVVILKNKK